MFSAGVPSVLTKSRLFFMNWFNSRIYQAVVTLFVDLRIVSWKKCDSETGTCFVFLEFQCSGIVNTRVIPRLCWWTYFFSLSPSVQVSDILKQEWFQDCACDTGFNQFTSSRILCWSVIDLCFELINWPSRKRSRSQTQERSLCNTESAQFAWWGRLPFGRGDSNYVIPD